MRSLFTHYRLLLCGFLFFIATLYLSPNANAQCTYSGNGFPPIDSLPCIVLGQSTDFYIPYNCLTSIIASYTDSFGGVHYSDRTFTLKIESLANIPCGLSIDIDSSQNPIVLGQTGCLHVHGTAQDTAGYYRINVMVSVNVTNLPSIAYTQQDVPLSTYLPPWRQLVIRLVFPGGSCTEQMEANKVYQASHCD